MSDQAPPAAESRLCAWRALFAGVLLSCRDRAIPGGWLCADHYIAHVQSTPSLAETLKAV